MSEPTPVVQAVQAVHRHVHLDADPEDVWEHLVGDGPSGWLGEHSVVEGRPGGQVEVYDAETAQHRRGRVEVAEPARRLAFTWWPVSGADDTPGRATTVELTLTPYPGGTRLDVVERPVLGAVRASVAGCVVPGGWEWRTAALELTLHRCVARC